MFRRLFRVTFKLGVIVAIGVGIAIVVKKLTTPADTAVPIEPWPPLPSENATPTNTNGDTASTDQPSASTS